MSMQVGLVSAQRKKTRSLVLSFSHFVQHGFKIRTATQTQLAIGVARDFLGHEKNTRATDSCSARTGESLNHAFKPESRR